MTAAAACAVLALAGPIAAAPAQTSSQRAYDETGVLSDTGATPDQGVLGERASGGPAPAPGGVAGARRAGGAPEAAGVAPTSASSVATGDPRTLAAGDGRSRLPFTGLDVTVIIALGLVLVALGVVARGGARVR